MANVANQPSEKDKNTREKNEPDNQRKKINYQVSFRGDSEHGGGSKDPPHLVETAPGTKTNKQIMKIKEEDSRVTTKAAALDDGPRSTDRTHLMTENIETGENDEQDSKKQTKPSDSQEEGLFKKSFSSLSATVRKITEAAKSLKFRPKISEYITFSMPALFKSSRKEAYKKVKMKRFWRLILGQEND